MWPAESRRGTAAIETALVAPLFLFIALCTADLIRVFRAQLRAEAVAVQIGQIVSQCRTITSPGDANAFWAHAGRIAGGVIDVDGGAVIVTAVGRASNANRALWRLRHGNVTQASSVAATIPGAATIANGFVVPDGQTLLVTEVYAEVQPWVLGAGLIGTLLPRMLNGTSLFLSRSPDPVSLQAAPRNSATAECTA